MVNNSKFKASILIGVVFLLGAIVGASLGTTIVSRKFAAPLEVSESQRRNMVLEKFKSRLRLTSDQAKQVQVILEQTHQRFKDLNQSIKPQSDEIRHGMRGRIRELLSEEQKKEFEVMTREYDQRRTREESS
jgi:DNA anti-recombination protein RmuC